MSRCYEAQVSVVNPRCGRQRAIAQALKDTGLRGEDFDPSGLGDSDEELEFVAQVSLFGATDGDYAASLASVIWEANQEYCEIEITMIYLEDPPSEQYEFHHDEYASWVTKRKDQNESVPRHEGAVELNPPTGDRS